MRRLLMNLEKTEIWITTKSPFQLIDGQAIRGFFGNMYKNIPAFHGHRGDDFVYKHPLIQYKVFDGSALVVGLKEGAYLVKAMPKFKHIEIHYQKYPIVKQDIKTDVVCFGLTGNMIRYSFATPWIGLNEANYKSYLLLREKPKEANALLERIVVGNILSMSKATAYFVKDKVCMKAKLKESGTIKIKNGVELMAFKGEFETNFLIPDFWGIGKFSSRGYGAIRYSNGGKTQ